jgi:hypothetical protein
MCTTGAVMEVHAARRRDRCPRNAELITVEEIAAGDFVTTSVLDFRPNSAPSPWSIDVPNKQEPSADDYSAAPTAADILSWTPKMRQLAKVEPCP